MKKKLIEKGIILEGKITKMSENNQFTLNPNIINEKLFYSEVKTKIKNDSPRQSINETNIQTSSSSNEEENNKTIENFNNGRWTEEEHKKFLEGILEYGNEWKKVQKVIKTRSSTQARSHAQKFFLKIKKNLNELNSKNNLNIDFNVIIKYIIATLSDDKNKEIVLNENQREKLLKIIYYKYNNDNDNLNDDNLKIKIEENKNNLDVICKKRKRGKSSNSKIFNISKTSSHKNSFESNSLIEQKNLNLDYEKNDYEIKNLIDGKNNNHEEKNIEEKNFYVKNPFNLEFKIFKEEEENDLNNDIFKFEINDKEQNMNCCGYSGMDYLNFNCDNCCAFDISENKNNSQNYFLIKP